MIVFFLSRAWFFIDYPMPFFDPDTHDYFAPVESILNNSSPVFAVRSPGFPMLILLIYKLGGNLFHIIAAQNSFSCLCGIIMLVAVWRVNWWSAPFASVGLLGWSVKSGGALVSDLRLMADSLYTSFLLLGFAFFLLTMYKKNKIHQIFLYLCSTAWTCSIIVKPNALFMIPVIFICIVALKQVSNFKNTTYISFVAPMVLIIGVLTIYNGFRSHFWGVSYVPSSNLHVSTSYLWEKDELYSTDLNERIDRIIVERDHMLTSNVKQFLMESDMDTFEWLTTITAASLQFSVIRAFSDGVDFSALSSREEIHTAWVRTYSKPEIIDQIRLVVLDTIRKNPYYYWKWIKVYLRRVALNTFQNPEIAIRFLQTFGYEQYYKTIGFSDSKVLNEWVKTYIASVNKYRFDDIKTDNVIIVIPDDRLMSLTYAMSEIPISIRGFVKKTVFINIYLFVQHIQKMIFDNKNWWFIFGLTFALVIANLLISKFKSYISWFVFLVSFAFISTSVLFTAIWPPIPRLIYPVEWSIYLTISLSLQVIVEFFSLVYPKLSYRSS